MPLPDLVPEPAAQRRRAWTLATHNTWFGGVYQDPSNFFAQIAVDPEPFMKLYPEYRLPPRSVCGVARPIARAPSSASIWRSGSIGRSATGFPIQGTIWQPKQGEVWEFNIVGMYDGDTGVDKTQFFFRYDYLDENRAAGEGLVGWYIVKIADASQAQRDGRHVRRDVRELLGRDQDDDREGLCRRALPSRWATSARS